MPFRLNCINPEIYYHEVETSYYPVFKHPPYDLALAAKMAEVIDREKLDILHVHYAMPHAISAILARDIAKHKDRKSTRLNSSHVAISYAVFCLKKKKKTKKIHSIRTTQNTQE